MNKLLLLLFVIFITMIACNKEKNECIKLEKETLDISTKDLKLSVSLWNQEAQEMNVQEITEINRENPGFFWKLIREFARVLDNITIPGPEYIDYVGPGTGNYA